MTTETPTSGIARATAPSELGASESEHRDTVNLDALDLEGLKRVARLYPELLNRLLDAAYAAGRAEVWEKVGPVLEPFAARCAEAVRPDDQDGSAVTVKTRHLRRAAKLHAALTASDPA